MSRFADEIACARAELSAEISKTNTEIASARAELSAEISKTNTEIASARAELSAEMSRANTEIAEANAEIKDLKEKVLQVDRAAYRINVIAAAVLLIITVVGGTAVFQIRKRIQEEVDKHLTTEAAKLAKVQLEDYAKSAEVASARATKAAIDAEAKTANVTGGLETHKHTQRLLEHIKNCILLEREILANGKKLESERRDLEKSVLSGFVGTSHREAVAKLEAERHKLTDKLLSNLQELERMKTSP